MPYRRKRIQRGYLAANRNSRRLAGSRRKTRGRMFNRKVVRRTRVARRKRR